MALVVAKLLALVVALFLWQPVAAWLPISRSTSQRIEHRVVRRAITSPPPPNSLEFTKENVDEVLEQVRPYLISDGGNIRVVGVEPSSLSVLVELEGACGSCPSSTTTMKMGVERVLREAWPGLGEVVNSQELESDNEGSAAPSALVEEDVEKLLAQLMPAIKGLKGSVSISSVERGGQVKLAFSGPGKLKKGIEMALRDDERVTDIIFVGESQ